MKKFLVQRMAFRAEIVNDKESNLPESGQGNIILALSTNFIKPNGQLTIIPTFIKSGYE